MNFTNAIVGLGAAGATANSPAIGHAIDDDPP
jgi:hypothetical protein